MQLMSLSTQQEKIDWLRLIRTPNVGPRTFKSLMEIYGSAKNAIEAIPHLAQKGGVSLEPVNEDVVIKEILALEKINASILLSCERSYPKLLREINDFPPVLTVRGDISVLNRKSVAIVGSRSSSANGYKIAEKMAGDLGKKNFHITSGLARGIDTAAHNGALATGTSAVIACGIDVVYPPENKYLYNKIIENGAVITEMPLGSMPRPQHFPRRNRIISGVSLATVIVEAALRSGSLITARYALEQNREIFGVPGSPLDQRSKGPNSLLREGAYIAESGDDVINVLQSLKFEQPVDFVDTASNNVYTSPANKICEDDVGKARVIIHTKLGFTPTLVDDLIVQTGISPNIVMVVLLELELAGKLERCPGNKVAVRNFEYDLVEKAL